MLWSIVSHFRHLVCLSGSWPRFLHSDSLSGYPEGGSIFVVLHTNARQTNKVWGKLVFLHLSVSHSVHEGVLTSCLAAWSHVPSRGSPSRGFSMKAVKTSLWNETETPLVATEASGTHPIVMHTCFRSITGNYHQNWFPNKRMSFLVSSRWLDCEVSDHC